MPARRRILAGLAGLCAWPTPARAQVVTEAALLVASPSLKGAPFARSVVLVGQGPDRETLGLIVNQPLDIVAPPSFAPSGSTVFRGGPVAPSRWFALAEQEGQDPAWLAMGSRIRMAAGESGVARLLGSEGAGRKRLFRGYAGWGPGQLGDEVRGGFWQARAVEADLVFDAAPATLWERLAAAGRAI